MIQTTINLAKMNQTRWIEIFFRFSTQQIIRVSKTVQQVSNTQRTVEDCISRQDHAANR